MIRLALILVLAIGVLAAGAGYSAGPVAFSDSADPTPAQTIKILRKQLAVSRAKVADKQDEIDAQDAVISDQADTIGKLRARLADPVGEITSGSPAEMWDAVAAIWRAFPSVNPGDLCGYDRSSTNTDGGLVGIALTSFTFYRWTGC